MMTRRAKNSHKSLQISYKHDYNREDSQSPYESNEEFEQQTSVSNSLTNSPTNDKLSPNNLITTAPLNPPQNEPTNSYINVAPLPTFHGNPNECPISHLSRFVKVCRANNASSTDMMMRIFPVTLESEAALWYDLNIEPYPSLSWDEIKISFLEAYHKIEVIDRLKSDLMMLKQGNEELVRSYFLRMQRILKKWPDHGLNENVLKGIFVDGLMEDFQDWILPQKPGSLNEALRLAFSYEQMKSIKGLKMKIVKCEFCGGSHEGNFCEVKERIMRDLVRKMSKKMKMVSEERKDQIVEEDFEKELEKSQCQCSRHQCWKKKIDRSSSLLSRKSMQND